MDHGSDPRCRRRSHDDPVSGRTLAPPWMARSIGVLAWHRNVRNEGASSGGAERDCRCRGYGSEKRSRSASRSDVRAGPTQLRRASTLTKRRRARSPAHQTTRSICKLYIAFAGWSSNALSATARLLRLIARDQTSATSGERGNASLWSSQTTDCGCGGDQPVHRHAACRAYR
jgi:hypothetical protein